jgi:hypothetical protein
VLRPRRERPHRRRAAKHRDEVAPLHCLMLPVLSTERIAHVGTAGDCRAAAFQSSLCRSWVKKWKGSLRAYSVRITPVVSTGLRNTLS